MLNIFLKSNIYANSNNGYTDHDDVLMRGTFIMTVIVGLIALMCIIIQTMEAKCDRAA